MLRILHRFPRTSFFLGGLAAATFAFGFEIIGQRLYGLAVGQPHLGYDQRPVWLHAVLETSIWVPWLAFAALLLMRWRGSAVRPIAFGVGALTPLVLLMVFMLLFDPVQNLLCQQRFDAAAWSRNDKSSLDCPTRLSMIDSIIEDKRLEGLARDEIVGLLGAPDDTEYFKDWDFVYHLGPERGFMSIDSEWLVIRFGPDGRVREQAVVRD